MASVNDYLKKLLYQYDCVVVPELGAFLTHYQPATFIEPNGLYLPPRKRVAFNEALRLDDSILANYIMLHEPVTREGAQRHIAAFVYELSRQVQQSGRFDLDEIGMFSRNDEGKLQFEPNLRHNFFGEAYGMSAVPAELLVQSPIQAIVVQSSVQTGVGPVLLPQDDAVLTPLRTVRPYWRIAAMTLIVGTAGLVSYFSVLKSGQPLQSSFDPATILRLPSGLFSGSTRTVEPLKPVITPKVAPTATTSIPEKAEPVAVVIPAKPVAAVPAPAVTKAETVSPKVTPAVVGPTLKKPVVIAAPHLVAKVAKVKRTTPHFTVIAGSFASKQNALRLKRQLRKAGYADAFVIFPTQKGQLYKVAAAGSPNRSEAVSGMAAINQLTGSESWLFTN